jgi:hypothetical protein
MTFRNSKRGKKAGEECVAERSGHSTPGALCPDGQWRKIDHPGRRDRRRLRSVRPGAVAAGVRRGQVSAAVLLQVHRQHPRRAFSTGTDLERCYSDLSLWDGLRTRGAGSTLRQQSGMARLRPEPHPRRRHLCGPIAPPLEPGAKFRILEKHSWRGHSFTYQAAQVKKLTERFNVQHIGIDVPPASATACSTWCATSTPRATLNSLQP